MLKTRRPFIARGSQGRSALGWIRIISRRKVGSTSQRMWPISWATAAQRKMCSPKSRGTKMTGCWANSPRISASWPGSVGREIGWFGGRGSPCPRAKLRRGSTSAAAKASESAITSAMRSWRAMAASVSSARRASPSSAASLAFRRVLSFRRKAPAAAESALPSSSREAWS